MRIAFLVINDRLGLNALLGDLKGEVDERFVVAAVAGRGGFVASRLLFRLAAADNRGYRRSGQNPDFERV